MIKLVSLVLSIGVISGAYHATHAARLPSSSPGPISTAEDSDSRRAQTRRYVAADPPGYHADDYHARSSPLRSPAPSTNLEALRLRAAREYRRYLDAVATGNGNSMSNTYAWYVDAKQAYDEAVEHALRR